MAKSLLCSMLALTWAIACGGTTDASNPPSGSAGSSGAGVNAGGASGAAAGGSSVAGTSSGGSAGKGGSSTGGATGGATTAGGSAGTSAGGSNGGSAGASGGGGNGGSGGVDSRCPPHAPMGACTEEQTDALCEYDSSGCLCTPTSPAPSFCAKVDAACPNGGAANAPAPDPSGGSSSKIALPTTRLCRCSGGSWQCSP